MSQLPPSVNMAIYAADAEMPILVLAYDQSQFDLFQSCVTKYAKKFVKMERITRIQQLRGRRDFLFLSLPRWECNFPGPFLVADWLEKEQKTLHRLAPQEFDYIT